MVPTNLDMDVLRTLVVATDLGGFVRAADRLGRSQSAISLQMKKLEDQVGQALFKKQGRGVCLTDTGDVLLGFARRILELNDEALSAARGVAIEGAVRLGLAHDLAGGWFSSVLARFSAAYPQIHVEAQIGRGRDLRERLGQGALDLALAFEDADRPAEAALYAARLPMVWIGRGGRRDWGEETLPLALLDAPCMFRQAGIDALEAVRRPWRLAFTSPSLLGLWAALEAGMGVTPRTRIGVPPGLDILPPADGLPPLPAVQLALHGAARPSKAAERLRAILIEGLDDALPGLSRHS